MKVRRVIHSSLCKLCKTLEFNKIGYRMAEQCGRVTEKAPANFTAPGRTVRKFEPRRCYEQLGERPDREGIEQVQSLRQHFCGRRQAVSGNCARWLANGRLL
ncbi:MAG: hypothetical protein QOE48_1805 [Mycobacterium sp.]|nr:hypothetical protein [Mycobacterium sp.]